MLNEIRPNLFGADHCAQRAWYTRARMTPPFPISWGPVVMSAHQNGHEVGRLLCDRLRTEIESLHRGLVRDEGSETCSFHTPPDNRFAFIYHAKSKPEIKIYFRGDPERPL